VIGKTILEWEFYAVAPNFPLETVMFW
ncbi:MAG: hypothetical protein RIQ38_1700, partial [Pseudomonadota bacterium]